MLRHLLPWGIPPGSSSRDGAGLGAGLGAGTAEQTRTRPRCRADWVQDSALAVGPGASPARACAPTLRAPQTAAGRASRGPEHLTLGEERPGLQKLKPVPGGPRGWPRCPHPQTQCGETALQTGGDGVGSASARERTHESPGSWPGGSRDSAAGARGGLTCPSRRGRR